MLCNIYLSLIMVFKLKSNLVATFKETFNNYLHLTSIYFRGLHNSFEIFQMLIKISYPHEVVIIVTNIPPQVAFSTKHRSRFGHMLKNTNHLLTLKNNRYHKTICVNIKRYFVSYHKIDTNQSCNIKRIVLECI